MNRWAPICQQCWQDNNPDQYCPELTDFDTCAQCGQDGLVLHVHPDEISVEPEVQQKGDLNMDEW